MAEFNNKPEPQKWIDRVRRAEKATKDKRDEAMRYKRAYMGDFEGYSGQTVSKYTVKVNFIYTYVEMILAAMFNGDPRVRGKAKKNPNDQEAAELWAFNTNYWAKELDARAEIRDAVFDGFFGPAAIYTGWEYETTVVEKEMPGVNALGMPVMEKVEEEKVLRDQPMVRWLDFWQEVRIDPDVKRTRRARWIAVRITVPAEEFYEMQTIKEEFRTGPRRIKPTIRPEDEKKGDNAYQEDRRHETSDPEWISFWEVWDREHMERKCIHESIKDDFINVSLEWPYELEHQDDPFPITFLHAKEDPFGPISFSEFKPVEDQIWERVRLRSVQAAITRRIAPKYLFQKGAGTKEQIKKLLTSDIMSANDLNDVSKFGLMPTPDIPQGFYQWDQQLAEDLGDSTGLSEFVQGQMANTATEASIAEGRSTMRRGARANQIERFVLSVMTKIGQLCQQFQNREVTFMVNPEELASQEAKVFNVTKEQIQGEFELELIPGTMEFVNQEVEKRDFMRFFEVAINSSEANQRAMLEKAADLFGVDPRKLLLTDEQKQDIANNQPKEPTLKFAPIKLEDMSPVDRIRVVEQAKKENDVNNLSSGPRQAAEAALQNISANQQKTAIPMNESQNLVGNPNPSAPVNEASMTGER